LLIVLGFLGKKVNLSEFVRNILLWVFVFFVSILGYSFRFEIKTAVSRVAANLIPSLGKQNKDGSISFGLSNNHHFMIDAKVNGQNVQFMLDTGATLVSLTTQDARKIGIDVANLSYTSLTSTANGSNYAALVLINEIKIGNIVVRDVQGSVNREGLEQSLLGMSFLNKLDGYEVSRDILTITGKTEN